VDNLISATSAKLQQDPNHEKALYMRASSYLKRGQLEEAIDDCNRLI
jgi:cytochrome c-type biogenesis protein CcmH/NrfG